MIWLISDTHFNHAKIRLFEPTRPENFEDLIFENIEKVLMPEDELWHLGDFTFGKAADRQRIADRWWNLKCASKTLIMGNHDRHSKTYYRSCGFDRLIDLCFVRAGILFSHYPRYSLAHAPKDNRYDEKTKALAKEYDFRSCVLQVHGHTHSWCHPDTDTYYNVSVENTNFMPVTLTSIEEKLVPAS